MTERTVHLTADDSLRLTPHDVPCGVQGEHRASAVEILLPTAANGYTLQIEAVDGLGRARESGPLLPQQADEGSVIRFALPREWTDGGGRIAVQLTAQRGRQQICSPIVRLWTDGRIGRSLT